MMQIKKVEIKTKDKYICEWKARAKRRGKDTYPGPTKRIGNSYDIDSSSLKQVLEEASKRYYFPLIRLFADEFRSAPMNIRRIRSLFCEGWRGDGVKKLLHQVSGAQTREYWHGALKALGERFSRNMEYFLEIREDV